MRSFRVFDEGPSDEIEFMMVDPKDGGTFLFTINIPHLLIPMWPTHARPVEPYKRLLMRWKIAMSSSRKWSARNITSFNAKVAEYNTQSEMKQVPSIDYSWSLSTSWQTLMMVASKEVEDAIIRLGQKGACSRDHMILATTTIGWCYFRFDQANVPSRVALLRGIIWDRLSWMKNGAEKLLGHWDMLFKPIDENHPIRLQGSFISDDDVRADCELCQGTSLSGLWWPLLIRRSIRVGLWRRHGWLWRVIHSLKG